MISAEEFASTGRGICGVGTENAGGACGGGGHKVSVVPVWSTSFDLGDLENVGGTGGGGAS